jgi:sec-independent protein translocase protein TatC
MSDITPSDPLNSDQDDSAEKPDSRLRFRNFDEGGKMSFFEHLNELRVRIIHSAIAIALGAFIGFTVAKPVLAFAARPVIAALKNAGLGDKLIFTHPAGYLNLVIQTALYLGLVMASPYVLYQIWLFIAPGLHKHERKGVMWFIAPAFFLFLTGIVFAYYVILPYLMKFLVSFQGNGPFTPLISIEEYFDLTLTVLLGVGAVFEMPVLIFVLSVFGLVTPGFLWKNFRYAILIISIVAAIITPTPDATTMLIFMSPMILLYIVGIGVSAFVVRGKRKAAEQAERDAGVQK